MIKFIKEAFKRQVVQDKTNKFVGELTDDIENLSDTEMVSVLNETKTRIKNFLDIKNENLNKELTDNKKAIFMLMNPNVVEENSDE